MQSIATVPVDLCTCTQYRFLGWGSLYRHKRITLGKKMVRHWYCLLYLLPHSPNPQHICLQIGISIPACFAKMVFSDTAKNNVSAHLLGRICLQIYLLATPVEAVIVPGRFLIILSRGRVRWGSPMLLTALQLRGLIFTIRQCLVLHISLLTLTLPLLRYWCLLTTRLLLNPV